MQLGLFALLAVPSLSMVTVPERQRRKGRMKMVLAFSHFKSQLLHNDSLKNIFNIHKGLNAETPVVLEMLSSEVIQAFSTETFQSQHILTSVLFQLSFLLLTNFTFLLFSSFLK